jgi:hypothetical protein
MKNGGESHEDRDHQSGAPRPLANYNECFKVGPWVFAAGQIASDYKSASQPGANQIVPRLRKLSKPLRAHGILKTRAWPRWSGGANGHRPASAQLGKRFSATACSKYSRPQRCRFA